MKKPNSKFKVELVKSNNDSPYVVLKLKLTPLYLDTRLEKMLRV